MRAGMGAISAMMAGSVFLLNHFASPLGCHYGKLSGMNMNVQMDQAGRVVLPKKLRERFRLQGGDLLALEVKGDEIHLRPQKAKALLERVNGVLVVVDEMPLPEGGDLVSESRDERIDEIARNASKAE
jgi:AbrB family looped-hinge helix DNA binding protein